MTQDQSNMYRDVTDFVRGSPVDVSTSFAAAMLAVFQRVSESRRGYVLIVGPWLVRLSEDDVGWVVQWLPQPSWIAETPGHLHSVYPVTLSDGWDVLVCGECGREW